jgi:hypothetical protein
MQRTETLNGEESDTSMYESSAPLIGTVPRILIEVSAGDPVKGTARSSGVKPLLVPAVGRVRELNVARCSTLNPSARARTPRAR